MVLRYTIQIHKHKKNRMIIHNEWYSVSSLVAATRKSTLPGLLLLQELKEALSKMYKHKTCFN
jgi:hypothetical protein